MTSPLSTTSTGAHRATPSHLGGFTSKSNKCATKIDEARQVLKDWLALNCSLTLNQSLITHFHKEREVRESSQMAWEGFGMFGASAASPGDVGWVHIDPILKLAVITCTGATLLLQPAALLRCSTVAKIRGTTVALKSSTCHLTENAITFYSKLCF